MERLKKEDANIFNSIDAEAIDDQNINVIC
jgi:hypothetical protein